LLEDSAIQSGVTKEEWRKFLAYVAGYYANMGNYYSFGDLKFAPDLGRDEFMKILKSNPMYLSKDFLYREVIDAIYP